MPKGAQIILSLRLVYLIVLIVVDTFFGCCVREECSLSHVSDDIRTKKVKIKREINILRVKLQRMLAAEQWTQILDLCSRAAEEAAIYNQNQTEAEVQPVKN